MIDFKVLNPSKTPISYTIIEYDCSDGLGLNGDEVQYRVRVIFSKAVKFYPDSRRYRELFVKETSILDEQGQPLCYQCFYHNDLLVASLIGPTVQDSLIDTDFFIDAALVRPEQTKKNMIRYEEYSKKIEEAYTALGKADSRLNHIDIDQDTASDEYPRNLRKINALLRALETFNRM